MSPYSKSRIRREETLIARVIAPSTEIKLIPQRGTLFVHPRSPTAALVSRAADNYGADTCCANQEIPEDSQGRRRRFGRRLELPVIARPTSYLLAFIASHDRPLNSRHFI